MDGCAFNSIRLSRTMCSIHVFYLLFAGIITQMFFFLVEIELSRTSEKKEFVHVCNFRIQRNVIIILRHFSEKNNDRHIQQHCLGVLERFINRP